MELSEYGEALSYEVAFWMQGLTEPTYPLEELGQLSLDVSQKLRALAVMTLLVQGDTDIFYHQLIRSGRARETYLQRITAGGLSGDHHQASGRFDALVDAIAANDFDLARRIIDLSLSQMHVGHEYEDDFFYAQTLHGLVHPSHEGNLQPILAQWETFLDGEECPRFAVCQTLVDKNQDDFDEKFDELLDGWDTKLEEADVEGPLLQALQLVFVEGLAILRIAEHRGLETLADYRYCPSLARIPMVKPFVEE